MLENSISIVGFINGHINGDLGLVLTQLIGGYDSTYNWQGSIL